MAAFDTHPVDTDVHTEEQWLVVGWQAAGHWKVLSSWPVAETNAAMLSRDQWRAAYGSDRVRMLHTSDG